MGRLYAMAEWDGITFDYLNDEVEAWENIYDKDEQMIYSVGIRFNSASTSRGRNTIYHYKSYTKLKAGDYVIVDSPYSGMACVEVVTCQPFVKGSKANKWIVDIVDTTAHVWRKNALEEMEELKRKMDAIADSMKSDEWQILRSHNAQARMYYARYCVLREGLNG